MAMNDYIGYGFTAVACLAIFLFWRQPKIAVAIVSAAGLLPLFLLKWGSDSYPHKGTWLLGVIAISAVVYIGCAAHLALDLARRSQEN
jgi:hypothetical protein